MELVVCVFNMALRGSSRLEKQHTAGYICSRVRVSKSLVLFMALPFIFVET